VVTDIGTGIVALVRTTATVTGLTAMATARPPSVYHSVSVPGIAEGTRIGINSRHWREDRV